MNKRKFGPWSKDEKDFIAANADKMSFEDIAKEIDRDPESVNRYIRKNLGLRINTKKKTSTFSSGTDIENSFIWGELQRELTEDELRTFLYHWNRIVIQFKEDVFPTEEMQIIDTIKLEIMMGRSLKNQKKSLQKIDDMEKEILALRSGGDSGPGFEMKLNNIEQRLIAAKTAYALTDKEFNDLLNRKSSMLKELKGTRDQRLKRIEDSKTTFVGWISELITNSSLRRELGLWMEKNRIASDNEEKRLMQPHKYEDGVEDLPLLTHETLKKLEEENGEEQWDKKQQ